MPEIYWRQHKKAISNFFRLCQANCAKQMAFISYFKRNLDDMQVEKKQQPVSKRSGNARHPYVSIFGWVVFLIAYGFLVPGLILPLYQYKVQGQVVEKTMWSTIVFVHEQGGIFPALLVAFFGIAVPAIKLVLVAIAHWRDMPWASRLVVWVSKWAIVDAIVACFIMAYYANAMRGAITSQIEAGFIFFVLYCTLSTAAALILDDRDVEFRDIYASRKWFKNNAWVEKKSTAVYSLAAAVGLSSAALILYTVRIGLRPELISMSVLSACNRLATEKNADPRPLVIILLFIVIVPVVEFIFMGLLLWKPRDSFSIRCALRCLPQCGLLDVYAVSVIVMDVMLNALKIITVSIPPLGYTILCVAVGATVVARFTTRRYLAKLFGGAESTTPLDRVTSNVIESDRVTAVSV